MFGKKLTNNVTAKTIEAQDNARIAAENDQKWAALMGGHGRQHVDYMSVEENQRRDTWAREMNNAKAGLFTTDADFDLPAKGNVGGAW